MFIVRCVPVVGTIVTAVEGVVALTEGDGKKFASKMAQTAIGGVMDAAFVLSGGASAVVTSVVTAPIKGGAIAGGKIAGEKVLQQFVAQEAGKLTTNIGVRVASEAVAKVRERSERHKSQSSGK